VESRVDDRLLGSTGFTFESPEQAAIGFVFARDAWGQGYATESLRAMVQVAPNLGLLRVYALCHPENRASQRVLEKCGFGREGVLVQHSKFPNLGEDQLYDVVCYARQFG
jgi:RimJ/RimL family protein N-acetyltransferase